MAKSLINKYVWLVETIHRAGRITIEELCDAWLEEEMSEGVELPKRTFHKWRIAVEEMFGIVIGCDRRDGYRYYLENVEELQRGGLRKWLFNSIAVSNQLMNNMQLHDRILLEEIPSGGKYLGYVMDAMKAGLMLRLDYQGLCCGEGLTVDVEPYCVKLYRQQWYLLGHCPQSNKFMIYGFDRITGMKSLKDKHFKLPQDFRAEEYFYDCFGVFAGEGMPTETVRLKVTACRAKSIRALPLHHSQQEVEHGEDYSVFELRLRPTLDFQEEVLSHTPDVEVLAPGGLRKEIAGKIEAMGQIYSHE